MVSAIFDIILNYGTFPTTTIYLAYVIVRDYKKELKSIQKNLDENTTILEKTINEQNEALNELIHAVSLMQNTMSNQMHSLLIKFIEISHKKNGGGK